MTATFWTGSSLSFTNGSKTVTVNTGPSLDSVKANSSLTAGNYNEPVEVKSVSGNTITLYNNWPGSTGTTSATIKPSAAAAASAGVAAQQLITEIQSLVGSASATATANSFVKRDSNGRIKAASPSANDDVVTKGYLGSAATRNVGAEATNLMEVGAFGIGTDNQTDIPTDNIDTNTTASGIYRTDALTEGTFPAGFNKFGTVIITRLNDVQAGQIYIDALGNTASRFYNNASNAWGDWKVNYHSGNTNFNEFGGSAGSFVATGAGFNSSSIWFYLPINATSIPSDISVTSDFQLVDSSNTVIETNVTPTLNGSSGLKVLVLTLSGLSGIVAGNFYALKCNGSSSKITVNF